MEFKKLILGRNLIGSNLVCYNLYEDDKKIIGADNIFSEDFYKLSTENCDKIFNISNIKSLASEEFENEVGDGPSANENINSIILKSYLEGAEFGFDTANELNRNNIFSIEDMEKCFYAQDDGYVSFHAYMENFKRDEIKTIEVIIKMKTEVNCKGNNDEGCFQNSPGIDCGCVKKVVELDEDGCLILIKA